MMVLLASKAIKLYSMSMVPVLIVRNNATTRMISSPLIMKMKGVIPHEAALNLDL